MITQLLTLDRSIFTAINRGWSSDFLDVFFPLMRNPKTWIPLYIFLIGYFLYKYKWNGLYYIGGIILSFGMADTLSAHIIKPWIHRLRPCNDPAMQSTIISRINCGSGFSFPSSHASNHFAIAVFLIFLVGQKYKWVIPVALLWAATISVAQVYVGVHYPIDITCGAILGTLLGYIAYYIVNKIKPIAL